MADATRIFLGSGKYARADKIYVLGLGPFAPRLLEATAVPNEANLS